ncbi:hypothetical protein AVEN_246823-1 [Araneus ventricosus]|uniref:Uncharacterized protein n=1 Tax=Araneus ventricosus TaxID=182803 RepID=A0A4Y2QT53_ARAVE|nr:hypothetical protein AVEN_246823-1 [Araneus ventricosus]
MFVCSRRHPPRGRAITFHPHSRPYQVGYYIKYPHRHQHAEGTRTNAGHVAGRYGYLDAREIGHQVNYVANHGGLRADIHTNEPVAVSTAVAQPVAPRQIAVVAPASTYGDTVLGLVPDYGVNRYALPHESYVHGNLVYRYGGILEYSGLLGNYENIISLCFA